MADEWDDTVARRIVMPRKVWAAIQHDAEVTGRDPSRVMVELMRVGMFGRPYAPPTTPPDPALEGFA